MFQFSVIPGKQQQNKKQKTNYYSSFLDVEKLLEKRLVKNLLFSSKLF